jgi:uncharacterized small protein (DUF1192 family)
MNVSVTEVLALLGSKTLEIAILEGRIAQLQSELDALKDGQNTAKQAQKSAPVVE